MEVDELRNRITKAESKITEILCELERETGEQISSTNLIVDTDSETSVYGYLQKVHVTRSLYFQIKITL